jgi:predicted PurR-regulated permease PerM
VLTVIGKRLFWVLLVAILFIIILGLIMHMKKQETIFTQAIKQQEQMIKQKEEQIQQLQEQLEVLRKEQVIREKRITTLKKQREQIQKPKTAEEVIKAFKELGYDAVVK